MLKYCVLFQKIFQQRWLKNYLIEKNLLLITEVTEHSKSQETQKDDWIQLLSEWPLWGLNPHRGIWMIIEKKSCFCIYWLDSNTQGI